MKLSNNIIAALARAGALNLVAILPENKDQEYKVIKFRREITRAFKALQEAESNLIVECSLELGEKGVLNGKDEDIERFVALRKELDKDSIEVDVKPITWAAWHELKMENKKLANAKIEDALESIFWTAPENEE